MSATTRKWFTAIPNIVLDAGLKPITLALYANIVRTVGWGAGACHKSSRTLARELGCSVGAVSKAKKDLQQKYVVVYFKPLIEVASVPRRAGGRAYHSMRPIDIWAENARYFNSMKESRGVLGEPATSDADVPSSLYEVRTSSGELKKNSQERRTMKELVPSLSPSPREIDKDEGGISEIWNFVQTLCGREPTTGTIPRRELRIIRELIPVSPDEIEVVRWWYSINLRQVAYNSTEYYLLERRPRMLTAVLRQWGNIVDVARYNRRKPIHLREL